MLVLSLIKNCKFAVNHLFNCENIPLLLLRKFVLLVSIMTTLVSSAKEPDKEYLSSIRGRSWI
jgi:hypothetical protein